MQTTLPSLFVKMGLANFCLGWPQTLDLPASALQVLELQECITTPSKTVTF
jgi:hypothetical protein